MAFLLVAIALLLLPQTSRATVFEEVILPVAVNAANKGEYLVLLDDEGRALIPEDDFPALGIARRPSPVEIDGRSWVPLASLEPDVKTRIDESDMRLLLDAAPGLLGRRVVDLREDAGTSLSPELPALFLNYDAYYLTDSRTRPSMPDLTGEAGVSAFGATALSTFTRRATDGRFVRLSTHVVRDDPKRQRRFIAGDFTGNAGPLGSQALMGGLRIARNFSLDPYAPRGALPHLAGTVATPSEIEIYQNGLLVGRQRVQPGQFRLDNVPGAATGLGQFDVRIRDAFGREQHLTSSYYFAETLLRKGVHEYDYSAGFVREGFGIDSLGYRKPALLARHSFGFTDSLTAGLAGEASDDRASLGPTASFLLGRAGELGLAGSASVSDLGTGLGGFFSHRFIGRLFSTAVSLRSFTPAFSNVSLFAGERPKLEIGAAASFDAFGLGSLTAAFSLQEMHSGRSLRRPSVTFMRGLTAYSNLFVTAAHATQDGPLSPGAPRNDATLFAGVQAYFGHDVSADVGHSLGTRTGATSVRVQKRPPGNQEGQGFGYEAAVVQTHEGPAGQSSGGSAELQYNGPFGVYTADYRKDPFGDTASFSMAGSVVATTGSVFWSRPVSESFAVVRTAGVGGVEVSVDNRKIGRTNGKGEVLVPDLLPYQPTRVTIDGRDLPLSYALPETDRSVVPRHRSGALVEFPIRKIQAFFGTIYRERGERWASADVGRIEIDAGERTLNMPIGHDGEFYFENVPPGAYRAIARFADHHCRIDLVVPESDEALVDLGEVFCG